MTHAGQPRDAHARDVHPLGARALLRHELLRWRTGWANALRARDSATRRRVLRKLAGGVLVVSALVWLATRVLGSPGAATLPAGDVDLSAVVALSFSLALLTGGIRRGSATPDPVEGWFVATGASANAIATRRLARALGGMLPLSWAPLIPLDDSLLRGEILRAAALATAGLAFALIGVAFGTLVRRHRLQVFVGGALLLSFAAVVAGGSGLLVPGSPFLALGHAVAAPWSWLTSPGAAIAAPGLAVAAVMIAFVAIRSDLRALGWTTGKRVREQTNRDAAAPGRGHLRTLATLEIRRLTRLDMNDAIAVGVIGLGVVGLIFVAAAASNGGQFLLTRGGAAFAGLFALLLPAIVAGELVWGRKPLSFWSYLRATGGDLRVAVHAQMLATGTVMLGWAALVTGAVVVAAGEVSGALVFAGTLILLALAAVGGGTLGAAISLRIGATGTRLGALIRYAGVAGSLAASAALCAWGSYIGAAALALVLNYAALFAAEHLIARTEMMARGVR